MTTTDVGVHKFLIISKLKRLLFRDYVVNAYHHHTCNGAYSFFETSTYFDPIVLNEQILSR